MRSISTATWLSLATGWLARGCGVTVIAASRRAPGTSRCRRSPRAAQRQRRAGASSIGPGALVDAPRPGRPVIKRPSRCSPAAPSGSRSHRARARRRASPSRTPTARSTCSTSRWWSTWPAARYATVTRRPEVRVGHRDRGGADRRRARDRHQRPHGPSTPPICSTATRDSFLKLKLARDIRKHTDIELDRVLLTDLTVTRRVGRLVVAAARLVDVDDLAPERRQRDRDQLEVRQAERDPDDRDAHRDAGDQVPEREPPAGEDDPDDVADQRAVPASGLRTSVRPNGHRQKSAIRPRRC